MANRRIPPLNALKDFEAAARHLSFTLAAAELNVTQAAVSHQVKSLEEYLQVPLFRRLTRKLVLTEEGRRLLPSLTSAFDEMERAVRALERSRNTPVLNVTVTPAFSSKWLVSRLGRFWSAHPEIDVRLHHSIQTADFERDEVDIGVRSGKGDWTGLVSERLLTIDLVPVCSPELLEGKPGLKVPADLKYHTLLHEDDYSAWIQWLSMAGVKDIDPCRGPLIDDPNVLLSAAADGRGVAMGSRSLVEGDLASGRLVQPFDLTVETPIAYHVVYRPGALKQAKVKAFRDFLMEEAKGL